MSQDFIINHINYTHSELLQKCEEITQSNVADWEKEVWAFVKEWLSDEEVVQVTTSGSTGVPKTMAIEKKYLHNSAMMTLAFLGLKPGDVALLCLSASYIAGKMMIVRALEGGLDLLLKEALGNPLKGSTEKIHFAA
ncbi:MAG: O-succinylbenzoic acid--CoA ligase, partial [Bacteroidales bacterium]|nr:O-succinylbenzoic acid--CoA ligase [Bacteroidales bacterium]